MVDEASTRIAGKALELSENVLRKALDAVENVRGGRVAGGPAPEEVKRIIDTRWQRIGSDEYGLKQRRARLNQAEDALEEAERRIFMTP